MNIWLAFMVAIAVGALLAYLFRRR